MEVLRGRQLSIVLAFKRELPKVRKGLLEIEVLPATRKTEAFKSTLHMQKNEPGAKVKSLDVNSPFFTQDAATLISKDLQKKIWGELVTPTVNDKGMKSSLTSQRKDVSVIYLQDNFATQQSLTHEFLGHLYLAIKGVPYQHEGKPHNASPEQRAKPEYNIRLEHKIETPSGEYFQGRVWDFMNTYAAPAAKYSD